ncbi:MAG: IclR family transcriptional regulator [Aquamicrobium sp.]|nr:IclR family transcriptional regulator [Aquamicrobium sp.]
MSNEARGSRDEDGGSGQPSVKSVEKAFSILSAFSGRDRFMSLAQISQAAGLDKSAVQRFTRTLCGLGYLEQDPSTRQYCLGRRVLGLSYEYLRTNSLIEKAAPVLIDLRRTVRERVDLTLRDGDEVVYVFRLQSKRETMQAALIGRRVPMFCSAGGRAILSRMPREEASSVIQATNRRRITPMTLIDPDAIMHEVDTARERGFAVQNQEWRLDEIVAAAAILDTDGRPVAAVHIAASTTEWDVAEFSERMGPLVAAAAQDVQH